MRRRFNIVYSIITIVYVVCNFIVGLAERFNLLIQTWRFVWRKRDRDSKFPIIAKFFAIVRAIKSTARFLIDVKTPLSSTGKYMMATLRNPEEERTEEEIITTGRKARLSSLRYHRNRPHGKKKRG